MGGWVDSSTYTSLVLLYLSSCRYKAYRSAHPPTHPGGWGLFYGGVDVFVKNLVAALGVAAYSFGIAYLIFRY